MEPKKLLLKSSNSTYNLKPFKKPDLLWALQFQFNCEIYPVEQRSSLKLPMDSQFVQATSLKSIPVPNLRGVFRIYTSRQSATLTKNIKLMFSVTIWIWISPLKYWNLSSSKILVLQWLLGFILVFIHFERMYFPKQFCLIIVLLS